MLLAITIAALSYMIPACAASALVGFIFRSSQINSLKKRVGELEKEMLQNHAEILTLQKENCELSDKLKNSNVPVIPISGATKENSDVPDVSLRKKLLGNATNKTKGSTI